MDNRWREEDAARFAGPLGECVYGSRLIGADDTLVLHGGGNTSVKLRVTDVTGAQVEALHVKGSGWDLATIQEAGFAPLRLARLRALLELDTLTDPQMAGELRCALLDAAAPDPSVETLLHALLPYAAVQHSHADAILTLTNLADGAARAAEVFGADAVVVPYRMPGFDLAKLAARLWDREGGPHRHGMVLLNHGLFTFGATTRESYHRHVELITRAERYLDTHAPRPRRRARVIQRRLPAVPLTDLARLRLAVSRAAGGLPAGGDADDDQSPVPAPDAGQTPPVDAGQGSSGGAEGASGRDADQTPADGPDRSPVPMILTRHTGPEVVEFTARPDLAEVSQRGPLTPDHVIRTKRVPLAGRDVDAYAAAYRDYFAAHQDRARVPLRMLDPAPRVILDPELGLVTAGRRARDADAAADIYRHTMAVIARGEQLGGYRALPAADLFDVEYWDLEQAKLRRGGAAPELTGEIALVTGAASGIGRACAQALAARGAAVVGLDRDPAVTGTLEGPAYLGVRADVTDPAAVGRALRAGVERFGGLDIVVPCAGIFPAGAPVAALDLADWEAAMRVNATAVARLLRETHPLLALSPRGARVVVVASKNVPAPGPGAAAYSASKAAVTQLARVTALEWAADGIRVNTVHPDAVFDTALWTPELLAARAARYGLSVQDYKRRNLLRTEVRSATVGRLVAELCTGTFAATTGAQIPVDGGNERVV